MKFLGTGNGNCKIVGWESAGHLAGTESEGFGKHSEFVFLSFCKD
jgi:hypothetical protein